MTMNRIWHAAHRMPRHATVAQRIVWHTAHSKQCDCRDSKGYLAKLKAMQKTSGPHINAPGELHDTVQVYIQAFPKEVQKVLRSMRTVIKRAVPNAVESISYRIPAYKLNNRVLIYFAGFAKHVSLYPSSQGMLKAIPALAQYQSGRGTLKFALGDRLPLALIEKAVLYRAKEVLAKSKKG